MLGLSSGSFSLHKLIVVMDLLSLVKQAALPEKEAYRAQYSADEETTEEQTPAN